jgi:ornithine carbamoyltransferase
MQFTLAHPDGYAPNPAIAAGAVELAKESGAQIVITQDAAAAVQGANAVYTDVWTSMGQEEESVKRRSDFFAFQVNEQLFAQARADAVFMHCLPAKRGEEATDGVLESSRSVVFDQAENRLHVQKALLLMMLS